jgi:hypothetical protein
MADPHITIAIFPTSVEAELARSKLDLEGIASRLNSDGHLGAVRLLVRQSQATTASDLLGQSAREHADSLESVSALEAHEAEATRCLICGSSLVSVAESSFPLRILKAVLLQIIPLPSEWFESRSRKCGVCGHEWKEERNRPNPFDIEPDHTGKGPIA